MKEDNKAVKKAIDIESIKKIHLKALFTLFSSELKNISKEELSSITAMMIQDFNFVSWNYFSIEELVDMGFKLNPDQSVLFCPFYLKDVFFPDEEVHTIENTLTMGWKIEDSQVNFNSIVKTR